VAGQIGGEPAAVGLGERAEAAHQLDQAWFLHQVMDLHQPRQAFGVA